MTLHVLTGIPFVLVSFLHILFLVKQNQWGRRFTKPFLMPLLLFFYLSNVEKPNSLLVLALLASFLGDVYLIGSRRTNVLAGIISFLIGHLFYIMAFLELTQFMKAVPLWFYGWLLFYLGIGLFIGRRLFPSMTSMKLAVGVYMVVILIMSFTSFARIWSATVTSFLLPFLGSILFIISDSLLAFDMFTEKKWTNHATIMALYIAAQLLIVLGFLAG